MMAPGVKGFCTDYSTASWGFPGQREVSYHENIPGRRRPRKRRRRKINFASAGAILRANQPSKTRAGMRERIHTQDLIAYETLTKVLAIHSNSALNATEAALGGWILYSCRLVPSYPQLEFRDMHVILHVLEVFLLRPAYLILDSRLSSEANPLSHLRLHDSPFDTRTKGGPVGPIHDLGWLRCKS